jgi:hypothetical protein
MFEKRKLDNLRIDIFQELGRRCGAEYNHNRYPPIYGLGPNEAAASIVAIGETLLDTLLSDPPVPKGLQRRTSKEIIRAVDLDRCVEASIFFAHALLRWIIVREECFNALGRSDPPRPADVQILEMLQAHFPLSQKNEAILTEEAPTGFPTLRETPETFTEPPPLESGYTMFLRDPTYGDQSFGKQPEDGEEPPDRLDELRDTHIMVSSRHFQVSASRAGLQLAMGNASSSSLAENDLRKAEGLDSMLAYIALKTWWEAAEQHYYEQLADLHEGLSSYERDQAQRDRQPPV